MKITKQVAKGVLILLNIVAVFILWLSAATPYFNPVNYPLLSCMGLIFPLLLITNLVFILIWLFVSTRYCLISFISLLCCLGTIRTYIPLNINRQTPPIGSIKILSYNTMAFCGLKDDTPQSPNPILQYIKNSDADIICLQEFQTGETPHLSKKRIDEVLNNYPYQYIYKIKASSNGLACYSKYPITFGTPIVYEESDYNASIMCQIEVKGSKFLVINNHLESNKLTLEDKQEYEGVLKNPDAVQVKSVTKHLLRKLADASQIRSYQARKIASIISNNTIQSIIVCGDFNDTPISYTYHQIRGSLKDAFVSSGNGLGISYNQNRFYFRIDHILHSANFKSYNTYIDRSISSSDHYPITTFLAPTDYKSIHSD